MTGIAASVRAWSFGLSLAALGPNLCLAVVLAWAGTHHSTGYSGQALLTAMTLAGVLVPFALSYSAWRRGLTAVGVFAAALQLAPWLAFVPFLIAQSAS